MHNAIPVPAVGAAQVYDIRVEDIPVFFVPADDICHDCPCAIGIV